MSTKKETNKRVCKTFWINKSLEDAIKKFGINISETCREALKADVLKRIKRK